MLWSYKAYCITPSFFSWLGRGTSRRGLPVAVRGGPCASCDLVTAVAGLEDVEEMYAAGARREARSEVVGFAVRASVRWQAGWIRGGIVDLAVPMQQLIGMSIT